MHYFSKDETLRQNRIRFVRIHSKDFVPVEKPDLCCAHFEQYELMVGSEVTYRKSWVPLFVPRQLVSGALIQH